MSTQLKISCFGCGQKLDVSELEPFVKVPCPSCDTELIIPRPFDSYLLEERLDRTRMTTVYRAMDLALDREICVKVLNPEFARTAETASLFINEASMASAINHPNVVPIYTCGETEGQPYIVMQFMPRGGLDKYYLFNGPGLPEQDVCHWHLEAAKGLESAYNHGILHHDLRPSNILLDFDNNVKVADFGLARVICGNQPLVDRENGDECPVTAEEAAFISPERISTGREDVRGDIYSFGASIYFLLTGRPPFAGESAHEVINARFGGDPPPPREYRKDISPKLDELVSCMLAVYPRERPRSYREVVAELTSIVGDAPVPTVVIGDDAAGLPIAQPVGPPPAARAKVPPKSGRQKKVITLTQTKVQRLIQEPQAQTPAGSDRDLTYWLWRLIPLLLILSILLFVILVAADPSWSWYQNLLRPSL